MTATDPRSIPAVRPGHPGRRRARRPGHAGAGDGVLGEPIITADIATSVLAARSGHYLARMAGEQAYSVDGFGTHTLVRDGGSWRVSVRKLTLTTEPGPRDLTATGRRLGAERLAHCEVSGSELARKGR